MVPLDNSFTSLHPLTLLQVRDLRAAWEPKPPTKPAVGQKPEPRERRGRREGERGEVERKRGASVSSSVRKDSDSSSRGRMGRWAE